MKIVLAIWLIGTLIMYLVLLSNPMVKPDMDKRPFLLSFVSFIIALLWPLMVIRAIHNILEKRK